MASTVIKIIKLKRFKHVINLLQINGVYLRYGRFEKDDFNENAECFKFV